MLPGVLSPVFAADWQVLGVISEEALKLRKVASGTARGRALVCPGVKETVPLRRKDRIRVACICAVATVTYADIWMRRFLQDVNQQLEALGAAFRLTDAQLRA